MAGTALFRAILLALAVLCWAPAASAQLFSAPQDDSSASGATDAWFAVDRLNAGLPPAPEVLDRSTPMGAVESLLATTRADQFDDAAHLLNLAPVTAERQSARGPELAQMLASVIENHVWLDWDELPDRPDGLIEQSTGNDPMTGKIRRSIVVGRLDLGPRSVPLRLNRLKPEGHEPVWVFSRQTVRNIPALYDEYRPGWVHRWMPPEWSRQSWGSLYRWELVALPLLVIAAVLTFLAIRAAVGRLAALLPWPRLAQSVRAARTPLAVLAATAPAYWATIKFVTFSAPVTAILRPVLIAVMVLGVTIALLRGIDRLIDGLARRFVGDPTSEFDQHQRQLYTTIYAIRRILLLVALVVGLGVVLMQLDVFSVVGISLLASAGVLTVILGIAAQPILGNLLSSLQIAVAKPIRIGDSVSYEGRWAYVEAIFYTFVRLRTWDDRRLIVPVQYFISHPFENYSAVEKKMTRVFLLTLDPRADIEELRQAYLEIARADEDVMPDEMLKALVVGHDHNGVVVRFYCTAKDAATAWNMHCRLLEQMLAWVRDHHPEWWPRQRELQFYEPTNFEQAAE